MDLEGLVTSAAPLVEIRDLRVTFGGRRRSLGSVRAVDGVSLDIYAGETMGLVGESGSGKTTLGRALLALDPGSGGSIHIDGANLTSLLKTERRALCRRVQMVFQDPFGSLNPRQTVGRTLATPLRIHHKRPRHLIKQRVAELLELVGLRESDAERYPHEFSGGQRQRIGIARALSVEPDFIVFDEPVSSLDVSIQAQILNLLLDLRSRLGLTFMFISHDLSVVRRLSDRVAVMYLGRIVETGYAEDVYRRSTHPYTRALLSAVPVPDPTVERRRQRRVLEGDLPTPSDPPSGCRFRDRCWLYKEMGAPERCRIEDPTLREMSKNRQQVACHFPIQDRSVESETQGQRVEVLGREGGGAA